MFTEATLNSALSALSSHKYAAAVHAKNHGIGDQYIIVNDPVHYAKNGMLVLMGHKPTILRSYADVRKFINTRS